MGGAVVPSGGTARPAPLRPVRRRTAAGGSGKGAPAGTGNPVAGRAHQGLDAEFKQTFAEILQTLLRQEVALLMVSHDIEFCARYAHRCALLFDGSIVTEAPPRAFFSGNSFYTTSANRMARG